MFRFLFAAFLLALTARNVSAQATGVPVYDETRLGHVDAVARQAATVLKKAGGLLSFTEVGKQLTQRQQCSLHLPPPAKEKLPSRDLWSRARLSHLRVGWLYKDHEKARWQVNLAGGFAITSDGAVATCYHVVEPHASEMKEGYLVVATDDDDVYPATEILAASHDMDTCILRVKADNLTPLPLSSEIYPGDPVVCFSEPMGRRGFYSTSHVNRFVQRPTVPLKRKETPPERLPVFLEVGNDWAPGSSGAAVLDMCGNAVGQVATIESVVDEGDTTVKKKNLYPGTVIVFHDAICARHVKELVKEK